MFRRLYVTFFRFAQQSAPCLSRGAFNGKNSRRWLTGLVGVQLGAATAVGLSDKELNKKPEWYKNAVYDLQLAIERTKRADFIQKMSVIDHAIRIFEKFTHLNNPELLWRLARVLVEKSELVPTDEEKVSLLKEAVEIGSKALVYEKAPNADLHKWYAIALTKLMHFDKKLRQENRHLVKEHFDKAIEINPLDPYTWMFLGKEYLAIKNYQEALQCFLKAEGISSNFSSSNRYYMGRVYALLKEKKKAIEELKAVFKIPTRSKEDVLTRISTRGLLVALGVDRADYDSSE